MFFESTGEHILTEYRLTDKVHIRLTTFLMSAMAWGGIDLDDGYFAFIDIDDCSVLLDIKKDETLLIGRGAVPLSLSLEDRYLSHDERLERVKRVVDSIERVYARARHDYDVLTSLGFERGSVLLIYGSTESALTLSLPDGWSIATNMKRTCLLFQRMVVAMVYNGRNIEKALFDTTIDSLNQMISDTSSIRIHLPADLLDMMIKHGGETL